LNGFGPRVLRLRGFAGVRWEPDGKMWAL